MSAVPLITNPNYLASVVGKIAPTQMVDISSRAAIDYGQATRDTVVVPISPFQSDVCVKTDRGSGSGIRKL